MAWNDQVLVMLRYHIFDIDSSNYSYTDATLNTFLLLGGSYVQQDLSRFGLDNSYSINVASGTMTPNPSDSFGTLMVLKAGCVLALAENKKNGATYGFVVKDDKSSIDGRGALEASAQAAKDFCKMYDDALDEYRRGTLSSSALIKGILSPYSDEDGTELGYRNFYNR